MIKAVTVWVLITVSDGSYNHGTVTYLDNIASKESCLFALRNIPDPYGIVRARCVQVDKLMVVK